MDEDLKKHLEKNRDVFDSESPSERVWAGIQAGMTPSGGESTGSLWWKVAAVFFMAVSVVLFLDRNNERVSYSAAGPVIYNEDFKEVKTFYTSIIEQKKTEFEAANADPDLVRSFENDLTRLDSAYSDLEKEYAASKNDRIVQAMINNLKTKIDVLSRYMEILNDMKEKESTYENQESV
jgi:hypothetical protein